MKTYIITAPEVWVVDYQIKADTPEEAYHKFSQMIGTGSLPEDSGREFSHIMQSVSWDIKEADTDNLRAVNDPNASFNLPK